MSNISQSMNILLSKISTNCMEESQLIKKFLNTMKNKFCQEADSILEVI